MKCCSGLALGLALATLAGCAASVPNRYYALPVPPASPGPATGAPTLGVGPVTIPEMLDRPQIVVAGADNQMQIRESDRWAESLGAAIPQVIAAYLSPQLPGMRVGVSSDVTLGDPAVRVLVDIVRLQGSADGGCDLDARWSVVWRGADKVHVDGRLQHHEAAARAGLDGVADAESRSLGLLAAAVADVVRSRR